MKRFGLLTVTAFCLFLCSGVLIACSKQEDQVEVKNEVTAEDVKKETREALEAAKAYSLEQKQEYQKKMEARLDEINRGIDELKAMAGEAGSEAKTTLDEQIAELEKKREAALKKLEELKSASAEAWEDLKSEVDTTVEDLENFIKELLPVTE